MIFSKTARRAALLAAAVLALPAMAQAAGKDVRIPEERVFPESLTSDAAGNLYAGSLKGIIFKAESGADTASPWIRADDTNKLQWILGVLAHDASNTLWVCSIPAGFGAGGTPGETAAVAFDLKTGAFKSRHVLPSPGGTCNDIAVGHNGRVYIAETGGGRILSIERGASEVKLVVQDPALVGVDGIAFTEDNVLYVNNTRLHTMLRVNRDENGAYKSLTKLNVPVELKNPDALRPYKGNMLLQAETGGRAALITIKGDDVEVKSLSDDTGGSAAITHIGDTAYTVPGRINYMFDPNLKDKDPGPFVIQAHPIGAAK